MKSGIIVLLSICLAGWLGLAHADNDAAPAPAAQANAPCRGTLYRIRHQGHTAYLFGAIHVGKPAFFPLEDEVTRALSRAGRLVLEIDLRKPEPFQLALHKHGFYPLGAAVEAFMRDSLREKTASSEFTHRILLDKRNPEMASKIEMLLREDGTSFVGVGLPHMVGDTGVPTLLRQRGYEVEKLY